MRWVWGGGDCPREGNVESDEVGGKRGGGLGMGKGGSKVMRRPGEVVGGAHPDDAAAHHHRVRPGGQARAGVKRIRDGSNE